MTWGGWTNRLVLEGQPEDDESGPFADVRIVSPGYLETMGVPLLEGRAFTDADRLDSPLVVLVNQRAVRDGFGGASPLGRRIRLGRRGARDRRRGRRRAPAARSPTPRRRGLLADDADRRASPATSRCAPTAAPAEVVAALRAAVAKLDPTVAVSDVATMDERLADARAPARFRALLTGALGGLALLLAMLGIYGSMAYAVRRQTRDIGIRLALGRGADRRAPRRAPARTGRRRSGRRDRGRRRARDVASAGHLLLRRRGPRRRRSSSARRCCCCWSALAAAYGPARWASRIEPMRAMRME